MNFKRKWLFFALPLLLLSAALFGVKWKADNPTPTAQDLAIRDRLLRAKEVWIEKYGGSTPGVNIVSGLKTTYHKLSNQERQDLANHLWLKVEPKDIISEWRWRRFPAHLMIQWHSPSRGGTQEVALITCNGIYSYSNKWPHPKKWRV